MEPLKITNYAEPMHGFFYSNGSGKSCAHPSNSCVNVSLYDLSVWPVYANHGTNELIGKCAPVPGCYTYTPALAIQVKKIRENPVWASTLAATVASPEYSAARVYWTNGSGQVCKVRLDKFLAYCSNSELRLGEGHSGSSGYVADGHDGAQFNGACAGSEGVSIDEVDKLQKAFPDQVLDRFTFLGPTFRGAAPAPGASPSPAPTPAPPPVTAETADALFKKVVGRSPPAETIARWKSRIEEVGIEKAEQELRAQIKDCRDKTPNAILTILHMKPTATAIASWAEDNCPNNFDVVTSLTSYAQTPDGCRKVIGNAFDMYLLGEPSPAEVVEWSKGNFCQISNVGDNIKSYAKSQDGCRYKIRNAYKRFGSVEAREENVNEWAQACNGENDVGEIIARHFETLKRNAKLFYANGTSVAVEMLLRQ